MAQTKYTCKDCVFLNYEDSEFPYCLGKDLYTDANPDDDACGDIIPLLYTCKDCFFFKNDICNNTTEKRYTSEENPSCMYFEYKTIVEKNKYIVMARIAKKKTVDNNAGLLKVVDGINRKDVESVTDFGHFFIVILKDCAIFHTHIGFEARFKRWGGVDMEGHALTTTTFAWLENLVAMKKEVKGKENDIFPETDVTYQDMLDSMVIITESNITHPLTSFLNADDAAKFAKEKLDYIGRMQKELETVMSTPVSEETEEYLKKNFEHGQQAILADQAAEALNQGKE